jgi:acyl-CoA thioesterase-2
VWCDDIVANEPLDLLRQAVGVEVIDASRARGDTSQGGAGRGGLFGGQMVAQSLSACAHTLPADCVPDSIHVNMMGASRSGEPIEFQIDRVRDGRALQHREVRGLQGGEPVLQALVVSSIPRPGLDWQESKAPDVGPPDVSPSARRAWAVSLGWGAFEIAYPEVEDTVDPPAHPLWVRAVADDVPDDPWLRGAAVAFWSDFGMSYSARRMHDTFGGTVSSVSVTHSLWLHRRPQISQWHLVNMQPQTLMGNQGFVHSAIFDQQGAQVASAGQGVFIRRPEG